MSEPTSSAGNIAGLRFKRQSSAPSAPASGYSLQYWRTDGLPYYKGPDNVEHGFGGTALAGLTTDVDTTGHARGHYLEYDALTSKYTDVPGPVVNGQAAGILPGNSASANASALVTLLATGVSVYLPAGTYPISGTGARAILATAGQWLIGDGMGKTILKYPDSVAYSSVNVYMVQISAPFCGVRDLTIQNGSGPTGTGNWWGVSATTGAYYPVIARVEVVGAWGTDTAGGEGIDLYTAWNAALFQTTLGTSIASGTRTVTPASMAGIYVGRRLSIGGTSEDVIVTATTATTFTAVFAHAHGSTDAVSVISWGFQGALIEGCVVRDSPAASGIVTASNGNMIRNNVVRSVGNNATRHGIYGNGGYNVWDSNWVEGSGGYNFHFHQQTPELDESGVRCINNTSINPITGHLVLDGTTSIGTNPQIPSGAALTRFAYIAGNVFRSDAAGLADLGSGVWINGVPAQITGNVFEDAAGTGHEYLDCHSTTGCIVASNIFRALNAFYANGTVYAGPQTVIADNLFQAINGLNVIIIAGDNCVVRGNSLTTATGAGFAGVEVAGAYTNTQIRDNYLACQGMCIILADSSRATEIAGNQLIALAGAGSAVLQIDGDTPNVTGSLHDNVIAQGVLVINHATAGLVCAANAGKIAYTTGITILPAAREMGPLLGRPWSGSLTAGYLVKLNSSGQLVPLLTSDTGFAAVSLFTGNDTSEAFFAGLPGTIGTVEIDGAWTAGHYLIPSTTTAGQGHDGGTSAPSAPASYGVFLNTGGSAGQARVLLVKTL